MHLRSVLAGVAVVATLLTATGCAASDPTPEAATVVRVPDDAATVQEAVDTVAPGGVVEIATGVYEESVIVNTPDITVRGLDRNGTVIDGGGIRPYGIVAITDGVTIENLTVTRATFYGVLVTGTHDESGPRARGDAGYEPFDPADFPPVQRFLVDHVTASNNGLYGIYAFNAQHGVIRDSYASGSADSGFYIGQCEDCDILVTGNVAERNAVGFENANASDSVVVAGNRFADNRVGMTLLSNYQEAFTPQRSNQIVGNLVWANDAVDTPAQADGAYAIGVGIAGGRDNVFERNLIGGHARAGVLLTNTEDLAAIGNSFVDTAFEANAVDVANSSAARAPASGNCVEGATVTTAPATLAAQLTAACSADSASHDAIDPAAPFGPEAPAGISFLKVAEPPAQPDLPDAGGERAPLPATVEMPDLSAFAVPTADLLADRAGGR